MALNPGVLDYTVSANVKFYHKAIAPLDHPFDLSPGKLRVFLTSLHNRALTTDWIHILEVPADMADPYDTLDMITQYGQISFEQVHDHVMSYNNLHNRAAQDSHQLFLCLMATLTEEAKVHMTTFKRQYTINNVHSGVALLKLIIAESYVDTNATTRLIRGRLSSLRNYMTEVNSDIEKFNRYVKVQVEALETRGEITQDLLANLFTAYSAASDREFKTYIKTKENAYDDGEEISTTQLMHQALTKYKSLVEMDMWNAPSEEETKIIALEAQLRQLSQRSKVNKKSQPKESKSVGGSKRGKQEPTKQGKRTNKPDWMTTKPKAGEPNKVARDGKDYWWCPKHACWVRHKPEECEGTGIKRSDLKASKKGKNEQNKALKISRALASIVQDEDEESE